MSIATRIWNRAFLTHLAAVVLVSFASTTHVMTAEDHPAPQTSAKQAIFVVDKPDDWQVREGRIEFATSDDKRGNGHATLLTHSLRPDVGHFAISVRAGLVDVRPVSPDAAVGWVLGDGIFAGVDGLGRAVIRDETKPNADRGIQVGSATIGITAHAVLQEIAIRLLGAVDTADETKFALRVSIHDPETDRLFSVATRTVPIKRLASGLALHVNPGTTGELARFWLDDWQASGSKLTAQLEAEFTPVLVTPHDGLEVEDAVAFGSNEAVYFQLTALPASSRFVMPRINNPIGKVYHFGKPNEQLKFVPEPATWVITLPKPESIATGDVIVVETIGKPALVDGTAVVQPQDDGSIVLPAHYAATFGEMLRYEPQPHKNTVGYWVKPKDYAQWHLNVQRAGKYKLHILQGCGTGQGGSEVGIHMAQVTDAASPVKPKGDPVLTFIVQDTGHFQNFVPRELGEIELTETGLYTLTLLPQRLAKNAIMDVREVKLVLISS